jgi:lysozyme
VPGRQAPRLADHAAPAGAAPYVCPAGFWTIGYGHLCNPTHPPISEDEGEAYLARDLVTALDATLRYCPVLATEPAIIDFTSSQRRWRGTISVLGLSE